MVGAAIALDTNILAYNIGVRRADDDGYKVDRTQTLIDRLLQRHVLHVSNQALAELYNVLTKTALSRSEAVEQLVAVRGMATTGSVTDAMFDQGLVLAEHHRFQIFDAIILSAAINVGATVLLSEDMQHGSVWSETTILNPFKPDFDNRLSQLTA